MGCCRITYIFKICVNIDDQDQLLELVEQLDDHLCLSRLLPNDPIGFCLGLVKFEIDGEMVKLALWVVNSENQKSWVRIGGVNMSYSDDNFHQKLLKQAQFLKAASA